MADPRSAGEHVYAPGVRVLAEIKAPDGQIWHQIDDPSSGSYFFNPVSQEARWESPSARPKVEDGAEGQVKAVVALLAQAGVTAPTAFDALETFLRQSKEMQAQADAKVLTLREELRLQQVQQQNSHRLSGGIRRSSKVTFAENTADKDRAENDLRSRHSYLQQAHAELKAALKSARSDHSQAEKENALLRTRLDAAQKAQDELKSKLEAARVDEARKLQAQYQHLNERYRAEQSAREEMRKELSLLQNLYNKGTSQRERADGTMNRNVVKLKSIPWAPPQ